MSAADDLAELIRRIGPQLRAAEDADKVLKEAGVKATPWQLPLLPVYRPGEAISYVVCAALERGEALMMPDNRRGRCSKCRRGLQYRPDVPAGARKICMPCAVRQVRGDA
jgi:hypothetical protein